MDSNDPDQNLRIYLNDHFAGSTGGLELARRAAGNSTDPDRAAMWNSISEELEGERVVLKQMLDRLESQENPVKALFGWLGEKAGRLKPNGQLTGPSELGQFVELEMLFIGVTGKLAMWRMLVSIDDPRLRDFDLPGLITQAESQRDQLDRHRMALGLRTFGG